MQPNVVLLVLKQISLLLQFRHVELLNMEGPDFFLLLVLMPLLDDDAGLPDFGQVQGLSLLRELKSSFLSNSNALLGMRRVLSTSEFFNHVSGVML